MSALLVKVLFPASFWAPAGNKVVVDVFEGVISWESQPRTIMIHCMEGKPLLGMTLLRGHRLTMDIVEDGPLTIERLA